MEYALTLGLHEAAIEVAFLLGDYQTQSQWAEVHLRTVKHPLIR